VFAVYSAAVDLCQEPSADFGRLGKIDVAPTVFGNGCEQSMRFHLELFVSPVNYITKQNHASLTKTES